MIGPQLHSTPLHSPPTHASSQLIISLSSNLDVHLLCSVPAFSQVYDLNFLKELTGSVSVPVIASGGAGKKEDFLEAFRDANVDACLAASLFHFGILPIKELKEYLDQNNIHVRI